MAKGQPQSEKEQLAAAQETRLRLRLLRQRFLGAAVVFSLAFLLWEVSGVQPPRAIITETAAAEAAKAEIIMQVPAAAAAAQNEKPPQEESSFSLAAAAEWLASIGGDESAATVTLAALVTLNNTLGDSETASSAAADNTAATLTAAAAAAAVTVTATAAPPPQDAQNDYRVQIGVYGQKANMEKVRRRVRMRGLSLTVDTINRDGISLHRVQLRNLAALADAQRLQTTLASIGYKDARIIAPGGKLMPLPKPAAAKKPPAKPKPAAAKKPPAKPKPAAAKKPPAKPKPAAAKPAAAAKEKEAAEYSLRLGSFSEHQAADNAISAIKLAGYKARVQPVQKDGERKFVVTAHGFKNAAEVNALKAALAKDGRYPDAVIEER